MSAVEYRAAVIGHTGRGNFGHGIITAFVGIPNVEMVAVADPDPAGRAEAATQSGAPWAYANPYAMLEEERPNLVAIATRQPDQHHDLFLAAAKVGAHIFSEKPLARSLDEADRMLAATDSRGLKVAVAHVWRVYPGVQRARELLEEGAIGQLRFMRSYGVMDHRGGGRGDGYGMGEDRGPAGVGPTGHARERSTTTSAEQSGCHRPACRRGRGPRAAVQWPRGAVVVRDDLGGLRSAPYR